MKVFNRINFNNLQGDIFGGLTATVIALPMALAFGVASGAGAEAGLYGAVLVGLFAALFGGTPTLISEPTGPMTVIMTAVIASLVASYGQEQGMAMAFTVVMMAGVFQILFGVLKLGKYVTLMPYTVISGFMSGIGLIMIILQLGPFLGQDSPKGGVVGTITALPDLLANIQPTELGLAALTVAILFLTPSKIKRKVPPQLIALVVGTIVSVTLFGGVDLRRIGEIPSGLPSLQFPVFTFEALRTMFVDALVLGMLGCIDALLTSVVADSLTRTQHDSNKELIGQGLGNIMSGLFGGIAGAGATMGTVINIQTGGRTALSGIVRAVALLCVVLFAGGLTQNIPLAVLAGIALKVGIDIIDWGFLKQAHKVSMKAALIMYGVIGLTVFVDLITAVGVGVFIANILTIDRLSELQSNDVKTITDADDAILLNDEEKELLDRGNNRVLLFHLSGPMIFGVAKAISREHTAMEDHDILIVDLTDVPVMGVTSSLAIQNAIQDALDEGRQVMIVGASGKVKRRLEKLGVLAALPPNHLFVDRTEALRQAIALLEYEQYEPQTNGAASVPSSTDLSHSSMNN
ncbi:MULTISPECIES: SulP family inorganic anion transporter [unclassified Roseofilum]|uniref:bicarbonate transporter BicA n=1 Tax=unclassified Roseofilum TaxID=2620099 RepID=UPI001B2485A5|nr:MULTISPECIES: SulP family inorganic anion transporter [unclassified Roseofilum]MBP0007166.1 SulP family inorganic anion transporter [Roseofilum sp. Belize Diploria]MBP0015680.1 SulP family inorganic anion transporter [Roseofilum sp. SID3]MBP0025401.1 SulP family inorganic anion transporter [Roseofilum sp. SID2]MBP0031809.1 SulP family inorganic anion transporter [Roseofilum sp. Belize BBD 4]MBP0036822.1 SulP family inorganic anion transporter [Roseofilum sp. SID1]